MANDVSGRPINSGDYVTYGVNKWGKSILRYGRVVRVLEPTNRGDRVTVKGVYNNYDGLKVAKATAIENPETKALIVDPDTVPELFRNQLSGVPCD